jgi:hypothetical protein
VGPTSQREKEKKSCGGLMDCGGVGRVDWSWWADAAEGHFQGFRPKIAVRILQLAFENSLIYCLNLKFKQHTFKSQ